MSYILKNGYSYSGDLLMEIETFLIRKSNP